MNAITANFENILHFSLEYGVPIQKKRAILREYLQTKILSFIYREKESKNLYFVGGTSLRLLHNLDRFSEDLDFDAPNIRPETIVKLLNLGINNLRRENINVDFYQNNSDSKNHFEYRFPLLLSELNLSQNRDEKLTIKFDFEHQWHSQTRELIMLNRYGLLVNAVTKTLDQMLVEKIVAYLGRTQTQPRDIYDIVWLISHHIKPDRVFAKANGVDPDFVSQAIDKYNQEKSRLSVYKSKLKPFLFDENNIQNLAFFAELLQKL